jgi:DNA mismatch repair ATPase MutS
MQISQNKYMSFNIDTQTIGDLELFESGHKSGLIYNYFNVVKTIGGRQRLKEMMQLPSAEIDMVERRTASIHFFMTQNMELIVSNSQVDFIEHYLESRLLILKSNPVDITMQHLKSAFTRQEDYYTISTGIKYILFTLKNLSLLVAEMKRHELPTYLSTLADQVLNFVKEERISKVVSAIDISKRENEVNLGVKEIFWFDNYFRGGKRNNLEAIINVVYEFDVLIAVGEVAREKKLTIPTYVESRHSYVEVKDLFHPLVENPVKNDFKIAEENICFLTGPNMAGKSTLLKSLALSVYLAHIGFPVAASEMKISVFDGLMTTINLSDNIKLGYSHFLSEVKRVKEAVAMLRDGKKYFIIFDELFKGTNVRDAYEASVLIIKALTRVKSSVFIISTHLIEIAEEIKEHDNIAFMRLESEVKNSVPTFSYKLKEGVSTDRIGMIIVKNEGIIDMLEEM